MKKSLPPFENWKKPAVRLKGASLKLREIAKAIEAATSPSQVLFQLKQAQRILDEKTEEITLAHIYFSLDVKDPTNIRNNNKVDKMGPGFSNAYREVVKAVAESPFRPELQKTLGSHYFMVIDTGLASSSPDVEELSIKENELTSEYASIMARGRIYFDGKVLNRYTIQPYMESPDREMREASTKAYYSYLESEADKLENIFEELVHIRDQKAKILGYPSYVELSYKMMGRYDYGMEDVAKIRDDIAGICTAFAKKLASDKYRRLGITDPDCNDLLIAYPGGNPKPKGKPKALFNAAEFMYRNMDKVADEKFLEMERLGLFDVESRLNKQGGGYMEYLPVKKVPFIFANWNGSSGDVDVLTHEFGHAFAAYMARDIEIPELRNPTMDEAEIDSVAMELFAYPYMNYFFSEPGLYMHSHLSGMVEFLPYGCLVDAFQEWVYKHPDSGIEKRREAFAELEAKYTPYRRDYYKGCPFLLSGRRWLTQSHIFEVPFYYIDYVLAHLVALELYHLDRENHNEAFSKYIVLLKAGGSYPFRELLKKAGIPDIFEPGSVERIIKPIPGLLDAFYMD